MDPILQVENLSVEFDTDEGRLRAVDDVSFAIRPGEVLGVVGESGCGKTVTAMSILRLIPSPPGRIASGRIFFHGSDLLRLPIDELRSIRGSKVSMIFQEPMTALSPLHTIGGQMSEAWRLHQDIPRREALAKSAAWLRRVGIPDADHILRAYPHQLSGGMRQRVMIAMALMLDPELLIADEPTTALDVTIQAQVFDLMIKLKREQMSLLLITHDMGVIWEMCDRMLVMYAGRIVEEGPVRSVFRHPKHPYTQGLMKAMPRLKKPGERLASIPGQVPSPLNYPAGCRFNDRCPFVFNRCHREQPELFAAGDQQRAACFLVDQRGGV